jgi:hypothetical protein
MGNMFFFILFLLHYNMIELFYKLYGSDQSWYKNNFKPVKHKTIFIMSIIV